MLFSGEIRLVWGYFINGGGFRVWVIGVIMGFEREILEFFIFFFDIFGNVGKVFLFWRLRMFFMENEFFFGVWK